MSRHPLGIPRLRAGEGEQLSRLVADLIASDETPDAGLLAEIVRAYEGLGALSPALVRVKGHNTPAVARAAQATENAWRRIDEEFGLLSTSQVAVQLGARSSNRPSSSRAPTPPSTRARSAGPKRPTARASTESPT